MTRHFTRKGSDSDIGRMPLGVYSNDIRTRFARPSGRKRTTWRCVTHDNLCTDRYQHSCEQYKEMVLIALINLRTFSLFLTAYVFLFISHTSFCIYFSLFAFFSIFPWLFFSCGTLKEYASELFLTRSRGNSGSIHSVWLRAGRPGDRGSIPGRGKGFFL
jgi:hypothetical protein